MSWLGIENIDVNAVPRAFHDIDATYDRPAECGETPTTER
jgi:hypothetical protein